MKKSVYILLILFFTSCSGDLEKIEYNNPFDTLGTDPPIQVNVGTDAGTGSPGSNDAAGYLATFNYPYGITAEAWNIYYIADTYNHKIRKIVINPTSVVSTYAGSGAPGSAEGTGTGASFNYPFGVAIDSSGNLYVADKNNHKIRKIAPGGVVTTLAGSGTPGDVNGTGAAASFNNPIGVAFDSSGNVYVADQDNNKIKKITSSGVVTTLAGSGTAGDSDGTGSAASFTKPKGVAVDSSGNVYFSDETHKIRKITSSGVVTTLAGSGPGYADGYRTSAKFDMPWGLAISSSGYLFVADQNNHIIRKVTLDGFVITYAGLPNAAGSQDGVSSIFNITTARFNLPTGVAYHSDSGQLHVADMNNHKIRGITR